MKNTILQKIKVWYEGKTFDYLEKPEKVRETIQILESIGFQVVKNPEKRFVLDFREPREEKKCINRKIKL